jgi:hypothetical protein
MQGDGQGEEVPSMPGGYRYTLDLCVGLPSLVLISPPYDLPGTQLFWDFCNDTIKRGQLEDKFVQRAITKSMLSTKKKKKKIIFLSGIVAINFVCHIQIQRRRSPVEWS